MKLRGWCFLVVMMGCASPTVTPDPVPVESESAADASDAEKATALARQSEAACRSNTPPSGPEKWAQELAFGADADDAIEKARESMLMRLCGEMASADSVQRCRAHFDEEIQTWFSDQSGTLGWCAAVVVRADVIKAYFEEEGR